MPSYQKLVRDRIPEIIEAAGKKLVTHILAKGGYTDREAQRKILANPFRRFEDMQMLRHTKTLGIIEVEPTVWKHLTADEKAEILRICDEKLDAYFSRL